jgi:hypothetical protein
MAGYKWALSPRGLDAVTIGASHDGAHHSDCRDCRSSGADRTKPEVDGARSSDVAQAITGEVASPLALGRMTCRTER